MFVGDSGPGFGSEQGVWHLEPRVELAHTSRDRVVAPRRGPDSGLVVTPARAQAAMDGRACAYAHPDDHCGDSPAGHRRQGLLAPPRLGSARRGAARSIPLRRFAVVCRDLWALRERCVGVGRGAPDVQRRTHVRVSSPTIMPGKPDLGAARRSHTWSPQRLTQQRLTGVARGTGATGESHSD